MVSFYGSFRLLGWAELGIAVPGKQSLLGLIAVDLFHLTNIQVMVAHFVELLHMTLNRHPAVGGNLDGAVGQRGQLNIELRGLVSIPARGAAIAHDRFGNPGTRDSNDDLFIFPDALTAVGGLSHSIGNHAGIKGKVGPPGHGGRLVEPSGFSVQTTVTGLGEVSTAAWGNLICSMMFSSCN